MNKLPVKWSRHAKKSLDYIVDYIRQDSPSNSVIVKRELVQLVGSLSDFPEKYPVDPYIDPSFGNFRFVPKWNYKIVYEVTDNEIIIIDIFHASQSPDKIMKAIP